MLLFHTHDEVGRPGWQSGLVHADGSPKTSLEPVRRAMESAGTGYPALSGDGQSVDRVQRRPTYDLAPMRARLHLPCPSPAPAASVDGGDDEGRAAAGRRVQVGVAPAETMLGWYQLSVGFLDATLPGRPVERAGAVLAAGSSPPRSLPDAEAAA